MKVLYLLLCPLWLGVSLAIHQIVEFQAKMIGGRQYFAHMGIAYGVAIEYGLAVIAVVIAILLLLNVFTSLRLHSLVRYIAIAFSVVTLYTYPSVIAPPLYWLAYVHLAVFPPEYLRFPFAAVALGAVTSMLAAFRRTD